MDEIDEQLGDEEIPEDEETLAAGDLDETAEEPAEEPAAAPALAEPGEEGVESIEEILVKKEARAGEEDEDDDALLALTREERLEPLAVKVVPPQATEFVCKNCHLLKHRSQLKDKAKQLCRDCA